jgi:hypothetical protein
VSSIIIYGIIIDMCTPATEKLGATPAHVQWTVVRGDSATLAVQFLEDDEVTAWDIEDWTFLATAYDPTGDILDELTVNVDGSDVSIFVSADISKNWGTRYRSVVAELPFDLQVVIPRAVGETEDTIWTPVLGTICVLGDVTPGGSL